MDYILGIQADVDVRPNPEEVRSLMDCQAQVSATMLPCMHACTWLKGLQMLHAWHVATLGAHRQPADSGDRLESYCNLQQAYCRVVQSAL